MTMNSDTVSVLEGNTFVVGRRNGDVDAGPGEPHGLFHRDTRHLSRWLLTIGGQSLRPLSTDDTKSFSAHFFLVPGTGSEYTDATLSVIRRRVAGDGFFEELSVLNHGTEPIRPEIAIAVGADFADLFEVKDATIEKPGKTFSRIEDGMLVLGYERGGYDRRPPAPRGRPRARRRHLLRRAAPRASSATCTVATSRCTSSRRRSRTRSITSRATKTRPTVPRRGDSGRRSSS
jgi:glycogen debranching enzyme